MPSQECMWSQSCRIVRRSPDHWFVCVCGYITEIGDKPAAGLSPKIDDKRLSRMTIGYLFRIAGSSVVRRIVVRMGMRGYRQVVRIAGRQPVVRDRIAIWVRPIGMPSQECMETQRADCWIVVCMCMHAGISRLAINPQRVYRQRSTVWHEVD